MSDTLLEPEDQNTWCDDCHGYTHMPYCPSYGFVKGVSSQTAASEHQPAARGGGEEWRVAQRFDGVVLIVRAESDNRETPLLTLSKSDDDYVMADRIVTEHNQHQALVAERERLRAALRRLSATGRGALPVDEYRDWVKEVADEALSDQKGGPQ